MSDDWITDPDFLYTLDVLKGYQVGDQVRLKECRSANIPDSFNGLVLTITALYHRSLDAALREDQIVGQGRVALAPTTNNSSNWEFIQRNIAAWRRPSGSKSSSQ